MDALKRVAMILRSALEVGGEGGAGLAQAFGGLLKRDLAGIFQVHHPRADLVGADGVLTLDLIDALRERFHAQRGVAEGGVDAPACLIDAIGHVLLK